MAYKGSSVSKLGPGAYYLVSLAAVFWMSRNAPPKERGALRDIQKNGCEGGYILSCSVKKSRKRSDHVLVL